MSFIFVCAFPQTLLHISQNSKSLSFSSPRFSTVVSAGVNLNRVIIPGTVFSCALKGGKYAEWRTSLERKLKLYSWSTHKTIVSEIITPSKASRSTIEACFSCICLSKRTIFRFFPADLQIQPSLHQSASLNPSIAIRSRSHLTGSQSILSSSSPEDSSCS